MMDWLKNEPVVYLNGLSGLVSFNGAWVESGFAKLLIFQVSWTAVALTAGTLILEGTQDPAQAAGNVIAITPASGFYGAWPTVGVTADSAALVIQNPMRFMRVRYARTAGGGDAQFTGFRELRGN